MVEKLKEGIDGVVAMSSGGLVGRRVRLVLARCDQTTDLIVIEGVVVHEIKDKFLIEADGSTRVVEKGWVVEIRPI
ncbi:hypothetical protein [Pyrobaculum aerophilum]|uniref:hypothetical protein n=1 Tax=Pyrobaculum aerophilum TaxID=13773 RepID=UPI002FD8E6AD